MRYNKCVIVKIPYLTLDVLEYTSTVKWWAISNPEFIVEELIRYYLYRKIYPDHIDEFFYDFLKKMQHGYILPAFLTEGIMGENYITDHVVMFDEIFFGVLDRIDSVMASLDVPELAYVMPKTISMKKHYGDSHSTVYIKY